MALPKVTPGSYNYGAYANPQQVKLADTSAIGKGIEKGADKAVSALMRDEKRRQQLADVESQREFTRERDETQQQNALERTKFSSDLLEQRTIRAEERRKKEALELEKFEQDVIASKIDSIAAGKITEENAITAAEALANVDDRVKRAVISSNQQEWLESHSLMKNFYNEKLEGIGATQIIGQQGKILKGLQDAITDDRIAFSSWDPEGLGAGYSFTYDTGQGRKTIEMSAAGIKSLIKNSDKLIQTKHNIGSTQEDQAAIGMVMQRYQNMEASNDPMYYDEDLNGNKVFNKNKFAEQLMNDPTFVNIVTDNESARNIFRTLTDGEDYDSTNTSHKELVARDYIDVAMRSIEVTNPSLFKSTPQERRNATTNQFGLSDNFEEKNLKEQQAELSAKLFQLVDSGQAAFVDDFLKSKDVDNVESMSTAEKIQLYKDTLKDTWYSQVESILKAPKNSNNNTIDMGQYESNTISEN